MEALDTRIETHPSAGQCDVSVIILTYNEEKNIRQALDSVVGWAKEIVIVDSFSTDSTLEICREYDCVIEQNRFVDYSKQRNFALDLSLNGSWILFLDADEWVPPVLSAEIARSISSASGESGFYMKRRLIWMGSWVRRGYYPVWILRLFRNGFGRCEERSVNEHIVVDGTVGYLDNDLMHEDRNGLGPWLQKHVRYAQLEAAELKKCHATGPQAGSQASKRRWQKEKIYNRLPRFTRCILFFFYRTLLRGGVLDGPIALTYHILHSLWYRFVIDLFDLQDQIQRVGCGRSVE